MHVAASQRSNDLQPCESMSLNKKVLPHCAVVEQGLAGFDERESFPWSTTVCRFVGKYCDFWPLQFIVDFHITDVVAQWRELN